MRLSIWPPPSQPQLSPAAILFAASMEFLQNTSTDEEDDEDEASFVTAPLPPVLPPIAEETLPLRYDHSQREGLAGAVALGGRVSATSDPVFEDYYTLTLRGTCRTHAAVAALGHANDLTVSAALTDGVLLDAIFLPHSSGSSHQHPNTWASILSHGAFSSDTLPPSPGKPHPPTPLPHTHTHLILNLLVLCRPS